MDLLDYDVRICVAGSRSFHDRKIFDDYLRVFLAWVGFDANYAFISGDAWRGPDRMIIDWCKEHDQPCFKRPANWKKFGKGAGYRRNAEMRGELTHLLVFWDGESKGTEEMFMKTKEDYPDAHVSVILVEPDAEWIERCRIKQERGEW